MAVGAADMPVIISMLNSYSGWALAMSGFLLNNNLLVIAGALVGSSGAILSYIMCTAMNRSFWNVLLSGFGSQTAAIQGDQKKGPMQAKNAIDAEQAAMFFKKSHDIIFVPGYGMASSHSQKQVADIGNYLKSKGKKIRFCLHPVAGRMPGHMNVLLAAEHVPISMMHELKDINNDFAKADLAILIGANDTANPEALKPNTAISGMAVCKVWEAKHVIVLKRKRDGAGFAGIDNPMFDYNNTSMLLGPAEQTLPKLWAALTKDESGFKTKSTEVTAESSKEDKKEAVMKKSDFDSLPKYRTITVPKEVSETEARVAIAPATVTELRKLNFGVRVEKGAGKDTGFTDSDYAEAGAELVDTEHIWDNPDIVIKVREPMMNPALRKEEAELAKEAKLLICWFDPEIHKAAKEKLMQYDNLQVWSVSCTPRITRAQSFDIMSSATKLEGYRAVIEAFYLYHKLAGAQFTAAGKISPATVFVNGCGVLGLSAIGTCVAMGAQVRAFDARKAGREEAASLGAEVVFDPEIVMAEGAGLGGYGKDMGKDYYEKQRAFYKKELPKCDIVISSARVPGMSKLNIITKETVRSMKKGSVIMDPTGSNCELTKPGEIFVDPESGVIICGILSFLPKMPQVASELYSRNMLHLMEDLIRLSRNPAATAKDLVIDLNDDVAKDTVVISKKEFRYLSPKEKARIEEEKKKKAASEKTPDMSAMGKIILPMISKDDEEKKLLPKEGKELVPAEPMKEKLVEPEQKEESAVESVYAIQVVIIVLSVAFVALALAYATDYNFMVSFVNFLLALVIGYIVVWGVDPLLHASLMSVTNAISGVIVIGAMLQLYGYNGSICAANVLGVIALFFAFINVFGGFVLTDRMLSMFA